MKAVILAIVAGSGVVLSPVVTAGVAGQNRRARVVLYGSSKAARWVVVKKILPALVDDPAMYAGGWMSWGGGPPKSVHLSPVTNLNAFAERIQFGTLERINGRTIYVKVDEDRVQAQVVVAQARALVFRVGQFIEDVPDFIEDSPTYLRFYLFGVRLRAIAWWAGDKLERIPASLREYRRVSSECFAKLLIHCGPLGGLDPRTLCPFAPTWFVAWHVAGLGVL